MLFLALPCLAKVSKTTARISQRGLMQAGSTLTASHLPKPWPGDQVAIKNPAVAWTRGLKRRKFARANHVVVARVSTARILSLVM